MSQTTNEIAELISAGIATEEQQGVALKALKVGMAYTLTTGMGTILKDLNALSELSNRAINKINERLNLEIESDSISRKELMQFVDTIQQRQIQIMDLHRKIIQGKTLFEEDILSEEEKMVVRLFKSFKTSEEKRKFLELCEKQLNESKDE